MVTPPTDNQTAPPVPTCYRHPGRETYVSCVRCGRPACPDCLRPAAVGHQCVECIREGSKTVRQATGRFGGRVSGTARVTWTIMGLNLVLFVVLLAHSSLQYDLGLVGIGRLTNNSPLIGVAVGQWYRLLTHAFIVPGTAGLGVLDIAFNMYALYIVGPAIERMLGSVRFLGVYLASALGGALGFYLLGPVSQFAMGASGAIFGLFGAWFVLAKRLRLDWRPVVTLIVLNLAIGFVGHSIIAWQAHIGGLITGLLLTAAYVYAPSRNRGLIQLGATAGVLALIVGGVVLRDYQVIHQVIWPWQHAPG
jgi:membrane associated rhomboid family serine protease